jgi:hypothetical protein
MATLALLDKSGRFSEPNPSALAALNDAQRVAVARARDAANALDVATAAAKANADALAVTQSEIATLEKVVPRVTFNDLAKAMARETLRRRMGV